MAGELKAKDLVDGIPQLTDDWKEFNNQLERTVDIVKKSKAAFDSQSKSQSEVSEKAKTVSQTTKQLTDIEKERLNLERQLKKVTDENAVANEELRLKVQQQKKANQELAKEKQGLISTYQKESKRLNDLRNQYKNLAAQNKANTKEAKALKKEITSLDKNLKKIDASVGQHQRNVGNYGDAMNALPGPIGRVINSMKMLAKVIFATPLGWLIGLIAGAGAALKSFFVGSAEGQERWNKTMNKAKGTISVFKDELIKAGKGLADFGKNIRESEGGIKGWAKELGQNAKKSIGDFFNDVKEEGAWNTLKDRAGKAVDAVKGKIDELSESLEENNRRAEMIAESQNKLRRDEIKTLTQTAQLRSDIAELRAKAADRENVTALERIMLLDKAIQKQNEILNIEENLAAERIRIQKLEMDQGENRLEDYEQLAKLEKDLIDLQTANAEKRRRFTSEQLTSTREFNAEVENLKKSSIDASDESIASFMESVSEIEAEVESMVNNEAKVLEDSLKQQEDARLESYEKDLENFRAIQDAKKEIEQEAASAIQTIITDQFNAGVDERLQKFKDSQEAQEEALKNKLDKGIISEKQFEDQVAKLRLRTRIEEAKAEKKKALFDIGINTALGIVKTIGTAGFPAAIPLIAAVAAIGAIQAAAVAAKPLPKFEDGGEVGGKRHSQGGTVIEAEKGEYVVSRTGYANAPRLTEMINSGLIKDNMLPKAGVLFSGADTPELRAQHQENILTKELINETRGLRSDIRKQKQSSTIITDGGMKKVVRSANNETAYINKYLRHSV